METATGRKYQTSLIIMFSDGLALRMLLYDGDRNFHRKLVFAKWH